MEKQILSLLKSAKGRPFSIKEISKTLDRKLYREDANWARPILNRLLGRGMVERNIEGHFTVAKPA